MKDPSPRKKNFRASKTGSVARPPVDEALNEHPGGKIIAIVAIVCVAVAVFIYMGASFYHALTSAVSSSTSQAVECSTVSSDKPGGDPARCARPTETSPAQP